MSELLLMMAARCEHLHHVIRPALAAGEWVVCDRFHDSSRVYQGLAGAVGLDVVDRLHEPLLDGLLPDLTILLDIDPAIGLARRSAAGSGGRFEEKGAAYHGAIREGFLKLARAEPGRFAVIDATAPEASVDAAVLATVTERLGPP